MNSSLLDEAIVDAQKLRELAEQTAKNKIVEAVMPQIREMINKRILGESLDQQETDQVEAEDNSEENQDDAEDDLNTSLAEAIANLVSERQKLKNTSIEIDESQQKLEQLEEAVTGLNSVLMKGLHRLSKSNSKKIAQKIVESTEIAIKLRSNSMLNENVTSKSFDKRLEKSIKELRNMARKNRNIFDFLFEEKSNRKLNEANISIEFDEEDKEALGDSYGELERILTAAGISMPGVDEDMEDMEDSDEDMEDSDEDMEDSDEDMEDYDEDMEDSDEDMELKDIELEDTDDEEDMEESWDARRETVYEVDGAGFRGTRRHESGRNKFAGGGKLMRAADYRDKSEADGEEETLKKVEEALMRRLRRQNRLREGSAQEKASHFGGGEVLGDVILDLDEDDLINVLADELGKYDGVSMPKMRAESRHRSRNFSNSRSNRTSSIDRARQARLQESAAAARTEASKYRKTATELKQQLNEMNLFNAKLLYANKLMQNKDLTMKQQRAIVEALDNAKTIREAKLLFESLTESLNRRTQKSNNLNEGMIRPTGSASRSTRSAAPANTSGVDSDRWAILAGIGK